MANIKVNMSKYKQFCQKPLTKYKMFASMHNQSSEVLVEIKKFFRNTEIK